MQDRWRRENSTFHPFRDRIAGADPLAKIVFFGIEARLFSWRTPRQKETCIKAPRREGRSHPAPHVNKSGWIDSNANLLEKLARRTDPRVFIRIKLPSRKCVKAALKHHPRRSSHPKHFNRLRFSLPGEAGPINGRGAG